MDGEVNAVPLAAKRENKAVDFVGRREEWTPKQATIVNKLEKGLAWMNEV